MRRHFVWFLFIFAIISVIAVIIYVDRRESEKMKDRNLFDLFVVKKVSMYSPGIFLYKIRPASMSLSGTISFTSDERYSIGDTLKIALYDRND